MAAVHDRLMEILSDYGYEIVSLGPGPTTEVFHEPDIQPHPLPAWLQDCGLSIMGPLDLFDIELD
jgi:hypothetical protein